MNKTLHKFLRSWLLVILIVAASGAFSSAYIAYTARQVKQSTEASLATSAGGAAGSVIAAALPPGQEGEKARALLAMLLSSSAHTEQWLLQQTTAQYERALWAFVVWSILLVIIAFAIRNYFTGGAQ
jgi:ABC-type multidrug transport system permease subunit